MIYEYKYGCDGFYILLNVSYSYNSCLNEFTLISPWIQLRE